MALPLGTWRWVSSFLFCFLFCLLLFWLVTSAFSSFPFFSIVLSLVSGELLATPDRGNGVAFRRLVVSFVISFCFLFCLPLFWLVTSAFSSLPFFSIVLSLVLLATPGRGNGVAFWRLRWVSSFRFAFFFISSYCFDRSLTSFPSFFSLMYIISWIFL